MHHHDGRYLHCDSCSAFVLSCLCLPAAQEQLEATPSAQPGKGAWQRGHAAGLSPQSAAPCLTKHSTTSAATHSHRGGVHGQSNCRGRDLDSLLRTFLAHWPQVPSAQATAACDPAAQITPGTFLQSQKPCNSTAVYPQAAAEPESVIAVQQHSAFAKVERLNHFVCGCNSDVRMALASHPVTGPQYSSGQAFRTAAEELQLWADQTGAAAAGALAVFQHAEPLPAGVTVQDLWKKLYWAHPGGMCRKSTRKGMISPIDSDSSNHACNMQLKEIDHRNLVMVSCVLHVDCISDQSRLVHVVPT